MDAGLSVRQYVIHSCARRRICHCEPFGNVPIFISLTSRLTSEERRNAIIKSMIIATAILLVFALIGKVLFDLLNVTLDSLRIAGGLLMLAIAFDMLMGKSPHPGSMRRKNVKAWPSRLWLLRCLRARVP